MIFVFRILLLVTFSICYLNFGHDGGSFIAQAEYDLLRYGDDFGNLLFDPLFITLFIGQVLILISMFNIPYRSWLTILGIIFLSIIVIFALLLGCVTSDLGTIVSTMPFIIASIIYISKRHIERQYNEADNSD